MEFNPAIAFEYARRISRPRQVGSSEEKKVAQEIKAHLERSGYCVNFQTFRFSNASEVFLFLEILTGMIIILSTFLTSGINQWVTLFLIGLLLLLILMIGPLNNRVQCGSLNINDDRPKTWWSSFCWNLGRRYETKNIIATLSGSSADLARPHLILVAHYDSKSQYLPLVVRIALFVILIVGSLVFAALTSFSLFTESLTPLTIPIGVLVILSGIPLLFLDYSNDSPGAIDDASGVGLVLHLADVIAKHPQLIENLGIIVLITSAEELAVKGALAYINEKKAHLRHQSEVGGLHVLNFDGIGIDGKFTWLVGEIESPNQLVKTCSILSRNR